METVSATIRDRLRLRARPDGVAENGADCDDQDAWVHPGAREICDPLDRDEDCDGLADDADESASHRRVFYGDADGDGFGIGELTTEACDRPEGFAEVADDCLDTDPSAHPGAADVWYDGIDSDCAGDNDYDADLDGHASALYGGDDCDDTLPFVNPGREEVCNNGLDDDCDGTPSGCAPWGDANAADAWARYPGPVRAGEVGMALSAAGDLDGDGLDDILVGAPGMAGGSGTAAGAAYLVPGGRDGTTRIDRLGTRLVGDGMADRLGAAVSGVGDANGDGMLDLLVGAPGVLGGAEAGQPTCGWAPPRSASASRLWTTPSSDPSARAQDALSQAPGPGRRRIRGPPRRQPGGNRVAGRPSPRSGGGPCGDGRDPIRRRRLLRGRQRRRRGR